MTDTELIVEPGRQDLVIRRTFDAPVELVWAAYTDPARVPAWWGGSRFDTRVVEMDVRRGGSWRFVTTNRTDGTGYAFRGVYHDVVPGESIVATFELEQGGPGYLQLTTDTFTEHDGATTLTSVVLFQSVEDRDGWVPTDMDSGIREATDRLAAVVRQASAAGAAAPADAALRLDVVASRTVDAPVERVWAAWTEPEGVRAWWGPAGWTCPEAVMDVRVGGSSRVTMRSPDGHDVHNLWTCSAVDAPRRLDFVLEFCDAAGRVVDPTELGLPPGIPVPVPHVLTFEELPAGGTRLTVTEHGYTSEATQQMSLAGLEQTLDKLVASVAGARPGG
ncbi:SRPBCC family protein [Cellulomonas sp. NS3]|uniref:SRPBCC family protein n=1 Tax=Cellulomonas sp. NS3 TaxID=2973977 RepID=UPI002163DB5A|nr:SRPBCC family protein [Cellulomonas sp. NS3]